MTSETGALRKGFLYKVWAPVNFPISDERGRTVAVLHHVEDVTRLVPPSGQINGSRSAAGSRDWTVLLQTAQHQRQVTHDLRQQVETLREALNTNRHISVAVGLLMAATGVNRDQAFQLLVAQSQSSNRKLRDIAADLVAQHELRFGQSPQLRPAAD